MTTPNKISTTKLSLPKGGGAIQGIGETFSPNEFTGTTSLSIPIPTSPCRGFEPQLSVSYSSGSGNGLFGLGWGFSIPNIARKTSKGQPQYNEDDTFLLSNADDLVPVVDGQRSETQNDISYSVFAYRPRTEGLFAKIEHWINQDTQESYWLVTDRDNITSIFGKQESARIADPENATHIYQWLLNETFDAKGNHIIYEYKAENSDNIPEDAIYELNRSQTANKYIARIQYGNDKPIKGSLLLNPPASTPLWHFEVLFDYGEYSQYNETKKDYLIDTTQPNLNPANGQKWTKRLDPFSSYQAGFEIRTQRLCRNILMVHHFAEIRQDDEENPLPVLVHVTHFRYDDNPNITKLNQVESIGYRYEQNKYLTKKLPPVTFQYTPFEPPQNQQAFQTFRQENGQPLPGLTRTPYQLIDLYGEGIPGILYNDGVTILYWEALSNGDNSDPIEYAAPENPQTFPIARNLPATRLLDLTGNGRLDLVVSNSSVTGYYEVNPDHSWRNFQTFSTVPTEFNQPDSQLVDVTGDGLADWVLIKQDQVQVYPSKGPQGFAAPLLPNRETDVPQSKPASPKELLRFADIFGTGRQHLVRIRNGSVDCWPNLGYGRFGSKVSLANAPQFGENFDSARLFLVDMDGSGTVDLAYIHANHIDIYFNHSGNTFTTEPLNITLPSGWDNLDQISFADVYGKGYECLIFSETHPEPRQWCYDFCQGRKPHLLQQMKNNMGAETLITYASSVKFYLKDKKKGQPWLTHVPFPVQVVEKITHNDLIAKTQLVSTFTYHHGFYDEVEREFRGFGKVTRQDAETFNGEKSKQAEYVQPALSKTWYHTGSAHQNTLTGQYKHEYYQKDTKATQLPDSTINYGDGEKDTKTRREAQRTLKGHVLRTELYGLDQPTHPYSVVETNYHVRQCQAEEDNRHAVFYVHPQETLTYDYERNPNDPRFSHDVILEVDEYGNTLQSCHIAYGRRQGTTKPEYFTEAEWQKITNAQQALKVIYALNDYINKTDQEGQPQDDYFIQMDQEGQPQGIIPTESMHLLGVPKENRTYEIKTLPTLESDKETLSFEQLKEHFQPLPADSNLLDWQRHFYTAPDPYYPLEFGEVTAEELPSYTEHVVFSDEQVEQLQEALQTALQHSFNEAQQQIGGDENFDQYQFEKLPKALQEAGLQISEYLQQSNNTDEKHHQLGQFLEALRTGLQYYNIHVGDNDNFEDQQLPDNLQTAVNKIAEYLGQFHDDEYTESHVQLPPEALQQFGQLLKLLQTALQQYQLGGDSSLEHQIEQLQEALQTAIDDQYTSGDDKSGQQNGELPADVFKTLLEDQAKGGYKKHDGYWWNPGLREIYYDIAQFCLPQETLDTFGNRTNYEYDLYNLLLSSTTDTWGNTVLAEELDYQVLHPQKIIDINDNCSEVCFDPLGMVIVTSHYGTENGKKIGFKSLTEYKKPKEAPTYDNVLKEPQSYLQNAATYFYYDLFSWQDEKRQQPVHAIQLMAENYPDQQTEPSQIHIHITYSDGFGRILQQKANVEPGEAQNHLNPQQNEPTTNRWLTSGRKRYNNKGKPVKQYEPYFINTPDFIDNDTLNQFGVSPTLYYDPLNRVVKIETAKGFLIKREWTPWSESHYDQNDTVKESPYYKAHSDDLEIKKAEIFDNTPEQVILDNLGHTLVEVRLNKSSSAPKIVSLKTWHEWDIEGNLLSSADPRLAPKGIKNFQYTYDMLGQRLKTESVDAGTRWHLVNVMGSPIYSLDARGTQIWMTYDELHRLSQVEVQQGDESKKTVEQINYGEGQTDDKDKNLRGRVYHHYDQAGGVMTESYTIHGQAQSQSQQLSRDYHQMVNYGSAEHPNDLLQEQKYQYHYYYDALGRITTRVDPDKNELTPKYHLSGKLAQVWLKVTGAEKAKEYVQSIQYNARGQRLHIDYGNNIRTQYSYDPNTYRLTEIKSGKNQNGNTLQDLTYTYDPVGNITRLKDVVLDKDSDYTYDALYELIQATGWESKTPEKVLSLPNQLNELELQPYTRTFSYDVAGNLYEVEANKKTISKMTVANGSNRAVSSNIIKKHPNKEVNDFFDLNGNQIQTDTLDEIYWNYHDNIQQVHKIDAETTEYYVYNSAGRRIRKVTERDGKKIAETIYLGDLEIRSENDGDKTHYLRIMDDQRVIATRIEWKGEEDIPAPQIHYTLDNHLGSCLLELDERGFPISYEEYYPYGGTTIRAGGIEHKHYHYSGKEKDKQTGLYYYGARYYAPELRRWLSPDPAGTVDGLNLYGFVGGNPILIKDLDGQNGEESENIYDMNAEAAKEIISSKAKQRPKPLTFSQLVEKQQKIERLDTIPSDLREKPTIRDRGVGYLKSVITGGVAGGITEVIDRNYKPSYKRIKPQIPMGPKRKGIKILGHGIGLIKPAPLIGAVASGLEAGLVNYSVDVLKGKAFAMGSVNTIVGCVESAAYQGVAPLSYTLGLTGFGSSFVEFRATIDQRGPSHEELTKVYNVIDTRLEEGRELEKELTLLPDTNKTKKELHTKMEFLERQKTKIENRTGYVETRL